MIKGVQVGAVAFLKEGGILRLHRYSVGEVPRAVEDKVNEELGVGCVTEKGVVVWRGDALELRQLVPRDGREIWKQ